jgi:hypothetical protein
LIATLSHAAHGISKTSHYELNAEWRLLFGTGISLAPPPTITGGKSEREFNLNPIVNSSNSPTTGLFPYPTVLPSNGICLLMTGPPAMVALARPIGVCHLSKYQSPIPINFAKTRPDPFIPAVHGAIHSRPSLPPSIDLFDIAPSARAARPPHRSYFIVHTQIPISAHLPFHRTHLKSRRSLFTCTHDFHRLRQLKCLSWLLPHLNPACRRHCRRVSSWSQPNHPPLYLCPS